MSPPTSRRTSSPSPTGRCTWRRTCSTPASGPPSTSASRFRAWAAPPRRGRCARWRAGRAFTRRRSGSWPPLLQLTEVLKQLQFKPLTLGQEVSILYAGVNGHLDDVELAKVRPFEEAFHNYMQGNHPEVLKQIDETKELAPEVEEKLKAAVQQFKESVPY